MSLTGGEGPTVIAVLMVETVLAILFIAARLYTRLILKPLPLGWDDWTIIISTVLLTVFNIMCMKAATLGLGRHSSTLTITQIAHANKVEIIGQTFCILGIATSKASVALFLMRIIVEAWQKVTLWVIIVALSIDCILTATINFVQCDPVAHVWNPTIPAVCWTNITTWSLVTAGLSIAADLILAILPWQIVYSLQMPKKDKLLIGFSLSFGILAAVCGIVRAIALKGLNSRSDYTYETVGLILWSSTELVITIISASIPTLRPLWHRFRGNLSSRYKHSELSDGFPSSSKNRPPFLSHHMRNLERKNGTNGKKSGPNTVNGSLFGTNVTHVGGRCPGLGDENSDKGILVEGEPMGQDIMKTFEFKIEVEEGRGGESSSRNVGESSLAGSRAGKEVSIRES